MVLSGVWVGVDHRFVVCCQYDNCKEPSTRRHATFYTHSMLRDYIPSPRVVRRPPPRLSATARVDAPRPLPYHTYTSQHAMQRDTFRPALSSTCEQ